jgi:protocatechuate 3,4-dioxygenase, alpha subunit
VTLFAGTPGQTVGPFFGYALPYPGGNELVPRGHPGAIRLHGRVLDGAGDPVPDALLEIWQTDPAGAVARQPGSLHRDGWTFTGWGRTATNRAGEYSFTTVLPGSAFIAMAVFARGLLDRLYTRVYLPGDDAALAADPLLAALPADRRATLVATAAPGGYAFDIVLQGERETVFLESRP